MPWGALPHGHLQLLRPQRRDGERGDTLSLRAQAVQDEGEIAAPDLGADLPRELRRLGQHEQDERDVGRLEVGPELTRGLDPLDQPGHQGRVALPGVPDPVPAVGGEHQQLPQPAVAGQHLGCLLQEADQPGPGIRRLGGFLGQRRHGVDTLDEQRLDQVLLGAEPPVDGPHPDAGVPRHLVQADVQAALGEDLRGRLEHALPVPCGITPQRPHRPGARLRFPSGVVLGALGQRQPPEKVETCSPFHVTVALSGDSTSRLVKLMTDVNTPSGAPERRRWLVLGVIGLAQLMVVLDATIMNIALPSAQRALHFGTADRQWVVTAYTLAFGSLLLLGGRLADLIGRKVTFMVGLLGFAGVSAIGGASVNFAMLVTARACQGVFAALLVPSALSLLTTTFTEPKDRGKAFGVYGAIAAAGGAVGLLLGGALTEYLSWR